MAYPAARTRRDDVNAQAQKTYDSVTLQGLSAPFLGIVEVYDANGELVDAFVAEKMTDFDRSEVRLRLYNVDEGRLGRARFPAHRCAGCR